jgi:hypothetical protein
MQKHKNAALVAAGALAALAACTIDARDRQRVQGTVPEATGEPEEASAPSGCVLHSDCPDGQACMNGACAAIEPQPDAGAPDSGPMDIGPDAAPAPSADAAESESESESESEGEPDASPPAEGDAGVPPADGTESESESESEAEAESESEPDGGAPIVDAGAPEADAAQPALDAGVPDAPPTAPISVAVVIEVSEGETVDASAAFCSTFGGGWACAPFALGGTSGREIRATYADVAVVEHVFNACLRLCSDPLNGVWMAYQSNGLQQRADPVVTVGEVVVPESLVTNGGLGANWRVDLQPPPDAPDAG